MENERGGGFPALTSPLPAIGIQKFTSQLFWNLPIQKLADITKKSINRGNFWRALLQHYQIPTVITKINQNYNDNDVFQGGNLTNLYPSISYDDLSKDVFIGKQLSDYFIYLNMTTLGFDKSLCDTFYVINTSYDSYHIPVVSQSPHIIGITRGISWGISRYIRWPI